MYTSISISISYIKKGVFASLYMRRHPSPLVLTNQYMRPHPYIMSNITKPLSHLFHNQFVSNILIPRVTVISKSIEMWISPSTIWLVDWIEKPNLHPSLCKKWGGGVWFYCLLSDLPIEKPPTPPHQTRPRQICKTKLVSAESRLWPSLHPRPKSHFPDWPKCPAGCLVCMKRPL